MINAYVIYGRAIRIRKILSEMDDQSLSANDLKDRINELFRIKKSVQKELLDLEKSRTDMQKQINALKKEIEEVKIDATKDKTDLEKLRVSLKQAKAAQIELAERNTPELRPPLKLLPNSKDNFLSPILQNPSKCTFGLCFDLSRCPLSSGFPVYFYNNVYGWTSTKDGYGYLTNNPDEACLFVVSYHSESKIDLQG